MSAHKPVSGRVDARSPLDRSALVGMPPFHQRPMSRADLLQGRPALKPQDLVGLLLRHRPWIRRTARPRVGISLSVYTPGGRSAVEIRL